MSASRGILAMCASMALFSINDTLVKLASARLPLDQIIFLRGVLAAGAILAWVVVFQPGMVAFLRHPGMGRVALRASLDVGATFLYLWALFNMPLPNAYAIYLSTPLMVTALAVVFFGDKVAWRRWSAIAAGAFGVLLVIQPLGDAFNWFSVAALAGTLFGAVRDVLTRAIPPEIPSLLVTAVTMVGILTLAGGSVAVTGWTPVVLPDLLLLAVAALFLTCGYLLLVVAMRVKETSLVAPFLYTAILWALLIGYFVWGDVPNLLAGGGIVILVASGLYLMHRERVARLNAERAGTP
jgi:drug/metabolite transporter (DMT)-like permease